MTPGKSKIFIGTNAGVYRSLDGGLSFQSTNSFSRKRLTVFDLKSFESTYLSGISNVTNEIIVACTNDGIWYSADDGDNWYKCGTETDDSELPVEFSYLPSNNIYFSNDDTTNYLAQTFITKNSSTTIDKVSALIEINKNISSNPKYATSLANNTVTAFLCSITSNLPDLSSYKCKSFFKNSAGKLVPEVIGYAYKPITELSIWLFPNYKKIIDKIKL